MPKYLHTRFVAEINLAVGQLLRVMGNEKEFLKLRRVTRKAVVFKDVRKHSVSP
jgi:hypothetical protein